MDDLTLNIEFLLNNPEVKAQAEQIKASLGDISKASDAQIERMVRNSIQDREARQQVILSLVAERDAIREVNEAQRRQQAVIDNSARSARGLGMSINQITRELPAFTYSAQTGFMAVANNIPILTDEINRLRAANIELTASGGTAVPVWKQLLKSFFSWNTLLSVGLTLLTVYGKEIGTFVMAFFKGKDAIDKAKKSIDYLNEAIASESFRKIISNVNELKINVDLAKKGIIDKTKVVNQYNESLGRTLGQVKALSEVENKLMNDSPQFIKAMALKAAAQLAIDDAAKDIQEAEKKRQALELKKTPKIELKVKDKDGNEKLEEFDISGIGTVKTGNKQIDDEAAALSRGVRLMEDVKNHATETQIKGDEARAERKNAVALRLQKRAAEILTKIGGDLFSEAHSDAKKEENAAAKADRDFAAILDSRKGFLDKLNALDAEYSRKSFSKDDEETQALKQKFADFREILEKENEKIADYNKTHKKKVGLIDIGRVDSIEARALSDLNYRQETAHLKEELEKQKQLYTEFEDYKLKFGLEKATEQFSKELDLNKTYLQKLSEKQEKLGAKSPSALTGSEQERLKLLNALIKEEKSVQEKAYQEAYLSAIGVEEKILQARTEYVQKYDALLKKQGSVTPEQISQLEAQKKAKIDAANDEAFQKSEIYEELNKQISFYTKEQLQVQISSLEEFLKAAKNLSPELRAKLEGELSNAKSKIGKNPSNAYVDDLQKQKAEILKNLSVSKLGTAEYQKQLQKLKEINGELSKAKALKFEKLADGMQEVSSMAGELSSAFQGVNSNISEALESLSQMAAIGGSAAGAAASFYEGDAMGGVTQSISAISGLVKMLDSKSQKEDEQARYSAELQMKAIESQTKAMERQLELIKEIYGTERLEKYGEALESINKKFVETGNQLGGKYQLTGDKQIDSFLEPMNRGIDPGKFVRDWVAALVQSGSVKTLESIAGGLDDITNSAEGLEKLQEMLDKGLLDEQTSALVQNLITYEKQYRETMNNLRAETTGTTFDGIADDIVEMFARGDAAAADFGKNFEEIMKKSILNSFKRNALEKELQEFYEQFAEDAKSDGSVDGQEMGDLRALYDSIIKNADEKFKQLELVTGMDFASLSNTSKSNLAGAIKGITEDQADVVAGRMAGIQLATVEGTNVAKANGLTMQDMLGVMRQKLLVLVKIAENTKRSADTSDEFLPYLKSIDSGVKDSFGVQLRAAGKYGY